MRAVYTLALGVPRGLCPVLRHDAVDHRRSLTLRLGSRLRRSDTPTGQRLSMLGFIADVLLIHFPVQSTHSDLQRVKQVPHITPVHAVEKCGVCHIRKGNRAFTVHANGEGQGRDRSVRHGVCSLSGRVSAPSQRRWRHQWGIGGAGRAIPGN